jgi:hypothetical protein
VYLLSLLLASQEGLCCIYLWKYQSESMMQPLDQGSSVTCLRACGCPGNIFWCMKGFQSVHNNFLVVLCDYRKAHGFFHYVNQISEEFQVLNYVQMSLIEKFGCEQS